MAPQSLPRSSGGQVLGDQLTLKNCTDIVQALVDDRLATTRLFIGGDHWQGGDGWIGPKPQLGELRYQETMAEIERAFTSRNVILEICVRHRNGVVGREPIWSLTPRRKLKRGEKPTAAEQTLIDEASAALTEWWDARGIHQLLQTVVAKVAWAKRAALRLFVPSGLLQDAKAAVGESAEGLPQTESDGIPTKVASAPDVAGGLALLHVMHPEPEQAAVYLDPTTQQPVGIFIEELGGDRKRVELSYAQGLPSAQGAGLSAPAGAGAANRPQQPTVVRVMAENAEAKFPLSLGGRLTMMEIAREPLITVQVEQQQRALNLAESMVPRNVVSGGFLERVLLNAQMPGHFEDDPNNPGVSRFVPEPFQTGAGTTQFVEGVRTEDSQGNEQIASPTMLWRPPAAITPTVDATMKHYAAMLDECDQAHVLINGSPYPSGKSRDHARAEFELSCLTTGTPTEHLIRWIIETALASAEAFAGVPGKYTGQLRCEAWCRIYSGPLSADESTGVRENVKARLLSRERAIEMNGIIDVAAELTRIESEGDQDISVLERRSVIFGAFAGADVPHESAALVAGFSEQDAALLGEEPAAPEPAPGGELPPTNAPEPAPAGPQPPGARTRPAPIAQ